VAERAGQRVPLPAGDSHVEVYGDLIRSLIDVAAQTFESGDIDRASRCYDLVKPMATDLELKLRDNPPRSRRGRSPGSHSGSSPLNRGEVRL
jgi:hypothetical protein